MKNISSGPSTGHVAFDRTEYLEALVLLVCRRKLPFNIVTWPEFRDFCLTLNLSSIESNLISSRSTPVVHSDVISTHVRLTQKGVIISD